MIKKLLIGVGIFIISALSLILIMSQLGLLGVIFWSAGLLITGTLVAWLKHGMKDWAIGILIPLVPATVSLFTWSMLSSAKILKALFGPFTFMPFFTVWLWPYSAPLPIASIISNTFWWLVLAVVSIKFWNSRRFLTFGIVSSAFAIGFVMWLFIAGPS